jgi:hypothetical protein
VEREGETGRCGRSGFRAPKHIHATEGTRPGRGGGGGGVSYLWHLGGRRRTCPRRAGGRAVLGDPLHPAIHAKFTATFPWTPVHLNGFSTFPKRFFVHVLRREEPQDQDARVRHAHCVCSFAIPWHSSRGFLKPKEKATLFISLSTLHRRSPCLLFEIVGESVLSVSLSSNVLLSSVN